MIYLVQNNNNTVTIDSWLEFIPEDILIHIDDVEIGTYTNISLFNEYIQFVIPSTDLTNLQNKEYKMKLYHNLSLMKVELCEVVSSTTPTINTYEPINKNIKMYERE